LRARGLFHRPVAALRTRARRPGPVPRKASKIAALEREIESRRRTQAPPGFADGDPGYHQSFGAPTALDAQLRQGPAGRMCREFRRRERRVRATAAAAARRSSSGVAPGRMARMGSSFTASERQREPAGSRTAMCDSLEYERRISARGSGRPRAADHRGESQLARQRAQDGSALVHRGAERPRVSRGAEPGTPRGRARRAMGRRSSAPRPRPSRSGRAPP
jgi:hypothetical protein